MNKQTNALLTILCLCVVSSFLSGCSFFEETICSEKEGQTRNGLVYLPNQEEPFTGKNLCKYDSGQKANEGNFKDGEKDGKWTWWYENGQKESEGNWKDGKEEGKWTEWYQNGQIKSEKNYKDWERDGKWTWWDENDQKLDEKNYKDGVEVD